MSKAPIRTVRNRHILFLTHMLLVTWYARNAAESDARRAIILGLCVYDAIGFVVTLVATVSGVLMPLGWSAVMLYLFFAVGFGYFLVASPQPATPASAT